MSKYVEAATLKTRITAADTEKAKAKARIQKQIDAIADKIANVISQQGGLAGRTASDARKAQWGKRLTDYRAQKKALQEKKKAL